jgi:replicative DNA helicase
VTVEPLVLAAIVEEGTPRKAYLEGISAEDFELYDEEFEWIEKRAERRQPITPRAFREKFPDFEWVLAKEPLKDLLDELRREQAYVRLNALIETVADNLNVDNALDLSESMFEIVSEIRRQYAPQSDFFISGDYQSHLERIRHMRTLRQQGILPGIPTGIQSLDFNWDGLVPGRLVLVLGRPGEGKSSLIAKFAWEGMKHKCRVGLFSPEMNEFEHTCRFHTMASAEDNVQEAVGITKAFRNRMLMKGEGFNIKAYKRLCEYLESMDGEIVLFSQKYRRDKMSPDFISSKVQDLSLDMVIVDPLYKLRPPRRHRDNRLWEIGEIVDALQGMAETFNIPVVICNQAHRQGPKGDAPGKDSSFNSDQPVQEADHVIGIKHESESRTLVLRCSKSRFGATFRTDLRFLPDVGVMKEIETRERHFDNGVEFAGGESSTALSELQSSNGTEGDAGNGGR